MFTYRCYHPDPFNRNHNLLYNTISLSCHEKALILNILVHDVINLLNHRWSNKCFLDDDAVTIRKTIEKYQNDPTIKTKWEKN